MRGRLLCAGFGCALWVIAPSAAADSSLKDAPRTTDELIQLYVAEAGYAGLTGLMVHDLAGQGSVPSFVLPSVGVAALAMSATAQADSVGELSLGQPQAIATDTWLGAAIGGAWAWHFDAKSAEGEGWSRGAQTGVIWAGATAGALIGAIRYEFRPTPPGQAAFTGSLALWTGAGVGLLRGALESDPELRDDSASLGTAVGLEVGLIAGSYLARVLELEPSIGWVRMVDAGALLGAGLAGGTYVLASGDELGDRATLGVALGGLVAGSVAAGFLAPKLGFTNRVSFTVAPDFALAPGAAGLRARGAF
jgi:hypothetical protein